MRSLDNKGFAITGILYTLMVLFLLVLLSVLNGLSSRKTILEKSTEVLEESYLGDNSKVSEDIEYVSINKAAPKDGKYVFEMDSAKNLLLGLSNSSKTGTRMDYSVVDKVITVTAKNDDGYGYIEGARVYLTAGIIYTFSCETTGIWGFEHGSNTVEAYFMKDGSTNESYFQMKSNKNFTFSPTISGEYWLRLDVNQNGKTHTFSNIRITDNLTKNTCSTYLYKGDKIDKEALNGKLIPKDCNDYNYTFDSNPDGIKMILKNIYSFEDE